MAQKKKTKKKAPSKKQQKRNLSIEIIGLLFICSAIFAASKLGFIGILIANLFRFFVGNTYLVSVVAFGLYGLYLVLKGKEPSYKSKKIIGFSIMYLSLLVILHARLFSPIMGTNVKVIPATLRFFMTDMGNNQIKESLGGGMIGALLYSGSHFLFSQGGTYFIASILMIAGFFIFFNLSFKTVLIKVRDVLQKNGPILQKKWQAFNEKRSTVKQEKNSKKENNGDSKQQSKNRVQPISPGQALAAAEKEAVVGEAEQLELKIDSYQQNLKPTSTEVREPVKEEAEPTGELNFEIKAEPENRDYQLPPTTLLNAIEALDQSNEYALIQENVTKLEATFKSFGVDAKVTKANLGPAVTKYEVQPAIGVKVSKIVSLSDDIALALAAKDIRIEAPIPGKAFIGIEVPNSEVSIVAFRDIIEAQPLHPENLLEVPLGRDITGSVATADLAKMPHLLVAGSTGSGKSVCINGIITSILMRAKPHEVKLMMIDPKMVELNVYNGIPHLLTPVVTNPKKAAQALQKVVMEMERRYELFAASGMRNITGYNKMVATKNTEKDENYPFLPYIVVIVDELADLMMVASNEVEDAIIRLAQMARAAGIHMILATQRPSVDVITGIIKANVPSRIAFAVSSGIDSRTIIDSSGAEKLLGRGDMLFLPMGENKPVRVQGAFISDEEVERIVEFITDQQGANYQEEMMPTEIQETVSNDVQDDLYDEAVQMVLEMQTASISLLQRRFRIGYNRAARLVDEMEMRGIVGPSEGSKPRKVNITHLPSQSDPENNNES
ncbi:cell division protein FtsK [Carnobacterium divergens]|uniref:FtsK/SpoIIIE family DNA translocase n=1 Tax=Carnobacterium divergens TaxID=2748 RepID=UPI0010722B9B|nr:DNA translocase FtsK [Carnobacterium divergens]TFJ38963.1 cell division protein FtsK [Carnobacterium divergens]TFJ48198.1 cell division protein FtsK [Carnobacterium divergens]TFJ53162.1 cell division protein FtsK [Carnobacterium divergens]TFJ57249.1 cell division protein FtsK [Carnobacterium divergens]TFJ68952.1 cell division protein FtsK [Carnobacterium divergens]